jgi:hypothetical protein
MSRTPDAFPGVRKEEGIIFDIDGENPSVEGEVRYVSGSFQMQDSVGVYDPRAGGGGGLTHQQIMARASLRF